MPEKMLCIYFIFIMCMTGMIGKLFLITSGSEVIRSALDKRKYTVSVDESRGYIYDRNLKPLVNEEYSYAASVNPTPEIIAQLISEGAVEDKDMLIEKARENLPFRINVKTDKIYSPDISVHRVINRYGENQLAPHITGHLDYDGKGAMGAEKAFDEYLSGYGGKLEDNFKISPLDGSMDGAIRTENTSYGDKHGVVLTLDKDIQRIAAKACENHIKKGAAVVMDVNSGDILAAVSLPEFNPNDISGEMNNPDKPFFNRAFAPVSVGSTFKMVVAACALENGISLNRSYECKGYVKVGDTIYHCQNRYGHGLLDMEHAMEKSCNPYFINLARDAGVQNICYKAMQLGLGSSVEILPGQFTPAGRLPDFKELENEGEATNFSFGQGIMSASPLQVCQMTCAIANGGKSVIPRLAYGYSTDGKSISEYFPVTAGSQVIEERSALKVKKLLLDTVEKGSGKKAKPEIGLAGGKTGSAQTGAYDENGEEIVHAWFTGFYPYEKPLYAVTVLCEGGDSGGDVCAPLFKEICDNISVVKS